MLRFRCLFFLDDELLGPGIVVFAENAQRALEKAIARADVPAFTQVEVWGAGALAFTWTPSAKALVA